MRVLFLGDIVGNPGRLAIKQKLKDQIIKNKIEFVIANGENAADEGVGITKTISENLFNCGVDVITTGKSSQECTNLVTKSGAHLIGFGCIIDRSQNKSVLKKKIVSQIELNIPTYSENNLPKSLSSIKAVKPGSRSL